MSYRTWPAALITGASLGAACVVVGGHMVQTRDGCLDSTGWFTATPAAWPGKPGATGNHGFDPNTTDIGPGTIREVGESNDQQDPGDDQIRGCLDLDRIEIPAPTPAPDGRA